MAVGTKLASVRLCRRRATCLRAGGRTCWHFSQGCLDHDSKQFLYSRAKSSFPPVLSMEAGSPMQGRTVARNLRR